MQAALQSTKASDRKNNFDVVKNKIFGDLLEHASEVRAALVQGLPSHDQNHQSSLDALYEAYVKDQFDADYSPKRLTAIADRALRFEG
jgi:hypothetical protein